MARLQQEYKLKINYMLSSLIWTQMLCLGILFAAVLCDNSAIEYERYDGWFNNLANPSWGTVGSPLSRVSPPVYKDGVYQPSGSTRPNPLLLSSTMMSSDDVTRSIKSFRNASVMMVFFAQHVAHEIVDTSRPGCPPEYMNIHVPKGREDKYDYKYIPFTRSNYHGDSGKSPNTPRQQINEATPWLDGGAIYGTSKSWTDSLRSFKDGKLAANEMGDWPMENSMGLPMSNPAVPSTHEMEDAKRLLKLGNHRGHENPFLLSFGILWFRYHNRMADKIKTKHPDWNDDKIFNEARKWVIATYQNIVIYEWLPAFLSPRYTTERLQKEHPYKGYKNSVHPGVSDMFQSAAMRFAETMVPSDIVKKYPDDCNYPGNQYNRWRLCNKYWNSEEIIQMEDKKDSDHLKPILYGMVNQKAEREDSVFVEDLQKFAYGPLEHSRRDLAAVTIQRGRDHGLPDYNTARMAFNLQPVDSFRAINNDTNIVQTKVLEKISELYKNDTDNVDIWVGGMLESGKHGPGELFGKIILDQFLRLRDGDRFWYENYKQTRHFTEDEVDEIKKTTFKDVIMTVTNIKNNQLQDDVFFVTNARCPVKKSTLKEECKPLKTYDYFSGSEIPFALTFFLVGLLPFIAVGVLLALAKFRNNKLQKQISQSRKKSVKRSVQRDDESRYTAIEWENSSSSRVVSVRLGPGTFIRVLSNRNQVLRIINLKHMTWITAVKQSDREQNVLSLRVQREYDLVLTFNDVGEREDFFRYLKSFIAQESLNVDVQEHYLRGRELFATAVTREARQQQLEKFFRAAFARAFDLDCGENCKNFKLSANEIKEILACELSQTEFADALGMQTTSPFVEQMFQLADKDCNGYISFREFLDIMFIFAKGTPEDKLKLFFDMYDVTGEGKLDREAFKKMMKSFMDVVSASVDPTNLDQLVDSMFKVEGGEEKEFLYFEDFGSIMMDLDKKDGLLSDVNNVFKGATDTIAAHAKSPKRKSAPMDTLTRKRHGTIVTCQRDRLGVKSPPIGGASPGRSGFTLARKVNIDFAPYHVRQCVILTRYIENHRQHIFILTLYTLLVIGAFIHTAYEYSVLKESSGFRRVAGYGVSVSRGAAMAMTLTFSTLLLTMSRNTLTFLRETQAMNWIPFDSAIAFHKYVAVLALFFTVVHTIGHAMNFYHFSTQSATALTCLFRNDFHRTHVLPTFTHYCWQTVTGLSGVLLCVVIAVLYVFATQYSRRNVFKFFWWTHQLYFALYALMIIHGSGHLIQPPAFHVFLIGPAVLFTIDKLISMSRKKVEIPVVKAELLPSDVTNLQFKRPVNFNYKSGQWVRIACLDLAGSEYHPFTLTTAPHEENLSLHIRAVGPWTMNLRNTYNKDNLQDRPFPKLYLDGPFGEGHQDWYRYEVSVLVGGGIGVTPFASILKDIAHKGTIKSTFACKQVYFLWVTRTQKHFEWLTDIIREVEEKDTTGLVTVHIFITQFYEKFDLRTTMLYICERHFQKISGRSLFTGLQAITHFGRPNFNSTLRSISDVHPEVGKIGVFSCGPPAMTNSVEKTCAELNINNGPTFIHHFENF